MSAKKPPRLYLDNGYWRIRDGATRIRTGCAERDRQGAEKQLAEHITRKYRPDTTNPNPLIADVLNFYAQNHVPHTKAKVAASYFIGSLAQGWGTKRLRDINAQSCREYASKRSLSSARRELEVLRAATRYFCKEHSNVDSAPTVTLPPKEEPRQRWLEREEVAALLRKAKQPHLRRFILLGIYTGSRSGAILQAKWNWIDWKAGTMARRAPGTVEDARKRTPRVKLGSRILAHLHRWHKLDHGHGHIVHYEGQPVIKLRRSWRTAANAAGLHDVTPHTLRHTRATWLMQAGTDLWEASGAMGMTADMMQRTYGHHHPDYQSKAANVDGRKR